MLSLIKTTWQKISADSKTVREFGFLLAGFFLLVPLAAKGIGVLFFHKPFHYGWGWLVLGALALSINLFISPLMALIYRIAMFVAQGISWVVMRIALGFLFYGVISPVAILMRLMGKDLLDEKIDRNAKSYWKRREHKPSRLQYEKLF